MRDFSFTAHHGRQRSLRTADWRFLLPIDGSGVPQLYDRRRDPGGHDDLAARQTDRARAMEWELRRFADEVERRC